MKDIVKKNDKEMSREEYVYHNTELLLKKFRDVRWSIEVSAIQAQISFELEMDCELEEFLEMSYAAGLDLTETHIQEQMRTLERNKKMLKIIETAIQVLRKKQVDGEMFYWILYYTYLWVRLHCEDEIFKKRCGSKDFDVPEEKVLERIETAKNKAA